MLRIPGQPPVYGLLAAHGAVFDPVSLIAASSIGATAIGTIAGAGGALMGGSAANQAAQFQAAQLEQNAGQAVASSQRAMIDTQQKSRLLQSKATANAAAGGANAGVGSPATDVGAIAKRGSYNAALDLFKGESTSTGLQNQAAGVLYSGQAAQDASYLSAFGTIAAGAGSMFSQYGRFAYPNVFGGGAR